MEDKEAYERAVKRVEAKLEFYRHLAIYVAVNILLIIINLLTSTETLWFIWPLLGWGIGIVVHAIQVFIIPSESSLKDRMIEREIEKLSKSED
jgi:phage shock protein PspC (stress-responsive transcriptional regulator)